MKKFHAAVLAALVCSSTVYANDDTTISTLDASVAVSAVADSQQTPTIKPTRLTFIDSRIFDVELFKYLEANKDSVEIDITGRVSLSSIPPRLDRWISKAAEGGGKVEVLPVPATRLFIFTLISMAFSSMGVWEKFREESAYDQAKKYDIKILYKKDATGETIIEKIVMNKRKK